MGLLELIGYLASVVVAISLMMKNIHRLRWWNLFGAASFSAYGALIGAWPVFVLNGFIAIVDIYYLVAMSRQKEYFDLLEIDIKTSVFTKRFLNFYKEDIVKYFPTFSFDPKAEYKAYFCLRDCRPVGLVLFSTISEKELLVELDYAIPEYRDMKNGKYFYHEGLKRLGIDNKKQFIIKDPNERHQRYLNAVGFKRVGDENGIPIYKR
ncbi:MAG: hypothetical protein U9O95_07545 [Candidatus Marinimicrobia bacterium]|nr:hypothetical protein [Candidatus Neomarinimicrobiota bacterium]